MANSRQKGKDGEREVALLWKSLGFENARRGLQFRDGSDNSDVIGVPYWVEVKRYSHLYPAIWANAWNQAVAARNLACEREYIPDLYDVVVMARENRKDWSVLVSVDLLRALRYDGENHQFQHANLVEGEDLRKISWDEWAKLVRIS